MLLLSFLLLTTLSKAYGGGGFCATCGFRTYITFDYGFYTFLGAECEYLMAEDCATNVWAVKTTKEMKPLLQQEALMISVVTIEYEEATVKFFQDGRYVQVNGSTVTLPYNSPSNSFSIIEDGATVVFSDATGSFKTTYNFRQLVMIETAEVWKDKTCGLCGSYNDNKCDDEPADKSVFRVQQGCGEVIPYGKCRNFMEWIKAIEVCHRTLNSMKSCNPIINDDWYRLCYREYCAGGNKFVCQYALEFGDVCYKFLRNTNVLSKSVEPCRICRINRRPVPDTSTNEYDTTACHRAGGQCLTGRCEGCKNGRLRYSKKHDCGKRKATCCLPVKRLQN